MDNLPDTLRIGYQDITVKKGKFNDEEDFGSYDEEKAEIRINTEKRLREVVNTVLHESLHAVWHVYGLRDRTGWKIEEEEYIVTLTAHALTAMFRDNPKLLVFLTESLKYAPDAA
jgi:hypothetical protein